jgi:hypothetical protein
VERLLSEAETRSRLADEANDRGENYVLLTVLFAVALVFTSIGGKLEQATSRWVILGMAVVIVILAITLMATYPVEI